MTYIGSCLANAFACLSYHFIKKHKEDLLYEMPHAMMGNTLQAMLQEIKLNEYFIQYGY